MRILTLQQRAREIGRIRMGQQVATASGKTRPAAIETFRFTSQNHDFISWAAATYGGDVREWQSPAGAAWEVVTEASDILVAIPSGIDPISQAYEAWSGGGCTRRCDGITEQISGSPCLCGTDTDPDARECKPTLRLSVMLPDCPIIGIVRLETHGYYGNVELPGLVDMVGEARRQGINVRAKLRLEKRQVKREGKTKNFVVPVIDVAMSLDAIDGGGPSALLGAGQRKEIEAGSTPALPPPDPVDADDFIPEVEVLGLISDDEIAVMWDEAQDAWATEDEAKAMLKRVVKWRAGVGTMKDIPHENVDPIMQTIRTWPDDEAALVEWESSLE